MVWSSEHPDFAAGGIDAANPEGLRLVLMQLINTASGRSRTPQHLFHIDGSYPSGEALKTADAGSALLDQFRTGGQAPFDATPNDTPGGQAMTRNPDRP